MRIDLHCHSTASDGTDSPAELVKAAAAAGLDTIAITDHDTFAGWAEAAAAGVRHGLTVVPGAEISCERDSRSIHLLGYLVDPQDGALVAALARARDARATRLEAMVERLAAGGIPIAYAAVLAHVPPGATPGRPHIADALVAAGRVATRDEAFARWLHDDSPYYVRHYAPDPALAVQLVRQAGGVAVLAHPFARARGTVGLGDDLVEELAAAGLTGIEADHPDHDPPAANRARVLGRRLGLLVTGSSDYHGTGKTARLGQHTTEPEVLEQLHTLAAAARVRRAPSADSG
ncbi:MAG: PHP domain-containing protein [Candidatus Phosphoribacter sp.]|nr:PHP domain-containing protein [Actinomycetales bacterium]